MTMHTQPRGEQDEDMVFLMFHAEGPPIFTCNFCDIDPYLLCKHGFEWANAHNVAHQKETAELDSQGFNPYEVTDLLLIKNRWEFPENMDR